MSTEKAFRCKFCGYLEGADHAGERNLPLACRVCNGGVKFHPRTGQKSPDPDNWEVLADCTPERLAELGLTAGRVCRHEGKCDKSVEEGKTVEVHATK